MTLIAERANAAFRDYAIFGVIASGDHEPVKAEVRAVFGVVDAALSSLGVNGAITVKKATLALLSADLAHDADVLAVVYNDSTPANNGIYAKVGASGAGSWEITALALPSSFADDLAEVLASSEATQVALAAALAIYGSIEAVAAAAVVSVAARDAALAAQTGAEIAEAGAQGWAALAAAATDILKFQTVAAIAADTVMSYTAGPGLVQVTAGNIVEAGGFRYEVVASGGHLTTAGGVDLEVLPTTEGWVSIEQLNAVYDGGGANTNQAAKVQALVDAGFRNISLGRTGVVYLASTTTTPNSTPEDPITITSHGARVQAGGNTRIFDIGQSTNIRLVTFIGSGETSGNTAENFIYISGNGGCDVHMNTFLDCGGTAVLARQYYVVHEGSQVTKNTFMRNKVAIDLQERGEYCTVALNKIVGNGTGIIIAGGNNGVTTNTITDNDLGIWVSTGANDAHGLVGDNIVNHNVINLLIDAINVDEMTFDANQFYVGKIVLNGCSGVVFTGGTIDSTCLIEQKGCRNCWSIGVRHSGTGGVNTTANDGSPSELIIINPVYDQAIAVTGAASMGTSYAKALRTAGVTLAAGASTDLAFNSDNTNAIPANAAYTVRDFFTVGTNKFQPKSQFLMRAFNVDFLVLITMSHATLPVAAGDIAGEILNADDLTDVLGILTVSRQKTLTSGRKARTLSFSGKLERKDFVVRLYNDSADVLTIEQNTPEAPTFAELIGA